MSHVIDFLNNGTPWAITQDALATIHEIARRENSLEAVLQQRGEPLDNTHKVEIRGNVALIPITGALFPRANLFNQVSGAYSVEMLSLDLAKAQSDPSVKSALLVIDSPGGHTTMINEFAAQIKAFDKPIMAYVVGQAASAAYFIAAATDKIYLDAMAMVGAIGIVTGFLKKDTGIMEFVSSNAPDKRPDLETDSGRAVIQSLLDDMEAVFVESVMSNRGLTYEQVTNLRGGVLVGAKAVSAGFADEISNLEAVIQSLNEVHNVDITKLKAEHPAVYQAAFSEGVNSINATALVADAVTTERTRISGILNHTEAKGRETLALKMALESEMNAEQAASFLSAVPIGATNQTPPPKEKTAFEKQMEALGNPKVGVDGQDDGEPNAQDDAAKLSASILSFLPAANVRK